MVTKNLNPLIYKTFLVLLIVGMHAEYQFSRFIFLGSEMQYSSVEFVIGFSILFLCGYVLYTRTDLKEIFKENILLWILSFFCLSLILSTIFARYKVEAIKYDIRIMATTLLFFLLLQFFSREKLKNYALIILNAVGIVVAIIGIMEYFGIGSVKEVLRQCQWGIGSNPNAATSVFIHNIIFAHWLVLLTFITLGQLKETTNKAYSIWLSASTGLFVFTLVLALSRGAGVAFAASLGGYLWIKRKNTVILKRVSILLLILVITVAAIPNARNRIIQTKNQLFAKDYQLIQPETRLDLYGDSLRLFKISPLVGVGLNNFKNTFYEVGLPCSEGKGLHTAHNQYLNVLAEQGIFGFIPFMGFVGYLIALGIRNIRRGGNEFFALAMMAYFVSALFDYMWCDYSYLFMFWFVIILNILEKRKLDDVLLRESPQLIAKS